HAGARKRLRSYREDTKCDLVVLYADPALLLFMARSRAAIAVHSSRLRAKQDSARSAEATATAASPEAAGTCVAPRSSPGWQWRPPVGLFDSPVPSWRALVGERWMSRRFAGWVGRCRKLRALRQPG